MDCNIYRDIIEDHYFNPLNFLNPVVAKYPRAHYLVFERSGPQLARSGGKRGQSFYFSPASVSRFKKAVAKSDINFSHFVTITFPRENREKSFCCTWGQYTRWFWQKLAASCREENINYIWVREPHKDRTPHYHVLTDNGVRLRELAIILISLHCNSENLSFVQTGGTKADKILDIEKSGHYMTKLASYCSKLSGKHYYDSYRHWARNYADAIPEIYEACGASCDYLRLIAEDFYAYKWPSEIRIPVHLSVGRKLPW